MPGTIGTYRDTNGKDVRALVTHEGAVQVLVDNDGNDPFGGRYVAQAPAASSAGASLSEQPDYELALAS